MKPSLQRVLREFLTGFSIAAVLGAALFQLPTPVWPHPDWYHQGIRLYRDEGEFSWYFNRRSAWVADGALPYSRGHEQEYPPLAVMYHSWPRLVTDDFNVYSAIFILQNAACYGALWAATAAVLRRTGKGRRRVWLLLLPATLYFTLWRFDILPAALTTLAFAGLGAGAAGTAVLLLAAGAAAKLYPAAFLVPTAAYLAQSIGATSRRRLWQALLAVTVVASAAMALLGQRALIGIVATHLARPFDYGTLGLALSAMLPALALPFVQLGFLLLQFAAWPWYVMGAAPRDLTSVIRGGLFLLLPLVIFSRFFSEGFLLWLLPIYLTVADRREMPLLVAFDLLIFLQFPILFGIDPFSVSFVAYGLVKYVLLASLWFLNAQRLNWLRTPTAATTATP